LDLSHGRPRIEAVGSELIGNASMRAACSDLAGLIVASGERINGTRLRLFHFFAFAQLGEKDIEAPIQDVQFSRDGKLLYVATAKDLFVFETEEITETHRHRGLFVSLAAMLAVP
jgi:hypothetical protein